MLDGLNENMTTSKRKQSPAFEGEAPKNKAQKLTVESLLLAGIIEEDPEGSLFLQRQDSVDDSYNRNQENKFQQFSHLDYDTLGRLSISSNCKLPLPVVAPLLPYFSSILLCLQSHPSYKEYVLTVRVYFPA